MVKVVIAAVAGTCALGAAVWVWRTRTHRRALVAARSTGRVDAR